MTPRRAGVLANALPPGSATHTALSSDDAWTTTDHLLANVVDLLNGANWQRAGSRGKAPDLLERPQEAARNRAANEAAIARASRRAAALIERRRQRQEEG